MKKIIAMLMDAIHKLKGPVGTIKFNKLYELCKKMEDNVAQSEWDSVQHLYDEMKNTLKMLQAELDKKKTFAKFK